MEVTTQYFGKWFFYKQVLEFNCPSKFLCQTSGRVKITGPYSGIYKWKIFTSADALSRHSEFDAQLCMFL